MRKSDEHAKRLDIGHTKAEIRLLLIVLPHFGLGKECQTVAEAFARLEQEDPFLADIMEPFVHPAGEHDPEPTDAS